MSALTEHTTLLFNPIKVHYDIPMVPCLKFVGWMTEINDFWEQNIAWGL